MNRRQALPSIWVARSHRIRALSLLVGGALGAACSSDGSETSAARALSSERKAEAQAAATPDSEPDQGLQAAASTPLSAVVSGLDLGELERRLDKLRKGGKTRVRYAAPEGDEGAAFGDWVVASVRAAAAGGKPPAAPQGFALESVQDGQCWLLHEESASRRGAGAVLLRVGEAANLVVQAPHTFFDVGTMQLGLYAFAQMNARAYLINTAHRANVVHGTSEAKRKALARSGELESDVAHASDSFFNSAHTELSTQLGGAPVVQLHGFRDGFVSYDAVVSGAGTRFYADQLADDLRPLLKPARIAAYPRDSSRLGGTTNAQAKASRRFDRLFVHIELSGSLRQTLLADAGKRERFLSTLQSAMRQAR